MRWNQITSESSHNVSLPEVARWLDAAKSRPDADSLYVHGSKTVFDAFAEPKISHGRLIHVTKLIDRYRPNGRLQAEYYGSVMYLVRINSKKRFSPLNDPAAKAILTEALSNDRLRGGGPVWDYESKIRYGRMDWQDCHLVVPPAVAAGYDLFEVFEDSVRSHSFGAAHSAMIEIIDHLVVGKVRDA